MQWKFSLSRKREFTTCQKQGLADFFRACGEERAGRLGALLLDRALLP